MASNVLISAINSYILKSNSWINQNKLPFLSTIMRNADTTMPADIMFTDADITEASYRLSNKYQGYSYKEWYDAMNDWLAKRIIVEAKTPLTSPVDSTLISTVSADSALPVEPKKSSNTLLIIGAVLVILLISRGKEG